MNIRPMTGSKPAADVAADLRDLAHLAESDPFVAAVLVRIFESNSVFPAHAAGHEHEGQEHAVMAAAVRAFKSLATEPAVKEYSDDFFRVKVPLRAVPIKLVDLRSRVCERVVTNVEVITEEIPDPDFVAPPTPMITRTREVETVEWKCAPLLAEPAESTEGAA